MFWDDPGGAPDDKDDRPCREFNLPLVINPAPLKIKGAAHHANSEPSILIAIHSSRYLFATRRFIIGLNLGSKCLARITTAAAHETPPIAPCRTPARR